MKETAGPSTDGKSAADSSAAVPHLSTAVVQEIYDQYSGEIAAFLQGVLRDGEAASEALQNTFRRVLEAGHTARAESLRGWLFRVAYNEAMALRRRERLNNRTLTRVFEQQPSESTVVSPFGRLIHDEEVARLNAAVSELPTEQRLVLERRIHRDQTFASIASELRLPLGTVLTRMRLALQKLQRCLKSPDPGER